MRRKAGYIDNNFSFLKFSRQSISNSSIPNQNFNLSSQTGILHNCPSCLTIWYKLPDGTSKVLEQGCFLNQELCHGSQLCIQDENLKQHLSLKESLSACCCTGSMCNREFLSNRNEASDLVVVFITSVVLGTISFVYDMNKNNLNFIVTNSRPSSKPTIFGKKKVFFLTLIWKNRHLITKHLDF